MAFTGAAVVTKISDRCYRVTGVSLAAGAAGVIGLFGSGLEVPLLDGSDDWAAYRGAGPDAVVNLADAVQVSYNPVAVTPATGLPLRVVKANGPPFSITITNDDGAAATPNLEIYVEFH